MSRSKRPRGKKRPNRYHSGRNQGWRWLKADKHMPFQGNQSLTGEPRPPKTQRQAAAGRRAFIAHAKVARRE